MQKCYNEKKNIILDERKYAFAFQGKKGQNMDQRHKQSLLCALDVLGQEQYKKFLKSIYLYGSCARGNQKFHSDVDIFLYVTADMPSRTIRELRSEVMPDDPDLPEVDLKISKCMEATSSRQFNKNLEKDGILLWSR